jgi:hypothetical protein
MDILVLSLYSSLAARHMLLVGSFLFALYDMI